MKETSLVQDFMKAKLESDLAIKEAALKALRSHDDYNYVSGGEVMRVVLAVEISEIKKQLLKF